MCRVRIERRQAVKGAIATENDGCISFTGITSTAHLGVVLIAVDSTRWGGKARRRVDGINTVRSIRSRFAWSRVGKFSVSAVHASVCAEFDSRQLH